jgi:hypothetical protein
MTTRFFVAVAATLAGCLLSPTPAAADPIHAIANGEFWHHDSGWIFPERIGDFVRVGLPQDVAGSQDAVAHYAWTRRDLRIVAAVDVFPADTSAEGATLDSARSALVTGTGTVAETDLPLANSKLRATRIAVTPSAGLAAQTLYFVDAGDWRVRIQVTLPAGAGDIASQLDAFVLAQRWDTLP